jgi:hypothetical protein
VNGPSTSVWWDGDPTVWTCDLCRCPVQRSPNGTLVTGLAAHRRTVHPNMRPSTAGAR